MALTLTLPVQRYLVPTPSTKGDGGGGGGGVLSRPLMISKTVDSTTFNFGRLSMRGKKTGRADDPILVRFSRQLIIVRVFQTEFC